MESLDRELTHTFPTQVYNGITSWVSSESENATAPLWDVVNRRYERLDELARQANAKESRDEAKARVKEYFEMLNPGAIADEIKERASLRQLADRLDEAYAILEEVPNIGPLVRRYHLPKKVLHALTGACLAPLTPTMSSLGIHAEQIKEHVSLMQSLAKRNKVTSGLGLAASVAGNLLLGPLGAIGARAISGTMMDKTDEINASASKVGDTFEQFGESYTAALETVDRNVAYVVASVLGGLLLRVQHDLQERGLGFQEFDLYEGRLLIGANEQTEDAFISWAKGLLRETLELEKQCDWIRLGDVADKAIAVTSSELAYSRIEHPSRPETFLVTFTRLRAKALIAAAEEAWQGNRHDVAVTIYKHLFAACTRAADEEPAEGPSSKAWLAIPALRLAVTASTSDEVSVVTSFATQVIARLDSLDSRKSAYGECITSGTVQVASSMIAYATAFGHRINSNDPILNGISGEEGTAAWQYLSDYEVDYRWLNRLIRSEAAVKDSEYARWVSSQARREWMRRAAIVGGIGIAILVILLSIFLYFA